MRSRDSPIEESLARLVSDRQIADIDPAAVDALERLLLDYVAVVIAGVGDDACARAADAFGGLSSTAGTPAAVSFAHGVCAHWFDWDDTHDPSHVHGGAVIFSALLALWGSHAAKHGGDGADEFVVAAIVGYEIACRIGAVLRRHGHRGWMPTGSGSTLGAAAACARAMGGDVERIGSAMGIAAANAGLSRQALADKANTKAVLAGIAAKTAVEAVLLDRSGIQGPAHFLSGTYGLGALQAGSDPALWDELTAPRKTLCVEEVSIKPYPCCRSSHAVIDAVLEFRRDSPALAEQITRLRVVAPPGIVERCGAPFRIGEDARLSAQFSIPYTAALALRRGRITLSDFSPAEVGRASREMKTLIDSIEVVQGSVKEDLLVPVEVSFAAGAKQTMKRTATALKGDPDMVLTVEDQREKLRVAGAGLCSEREIAEVEGIVREVRAVGPQTLITWLADVARRRSSIR